MLHQTEKGESVLLEIENELAALTIKRQEPAIEVDDEEPGTSSVGGEKSSAEMPPPVMAPKAKKFPVQLEKLAVKKGKPEVKAMPKMPEKEQRHDYEGEKDRRERAMEIMRMLKWWTEKRSQKVNFTYCSRSSSGT